MSEGRKPRVTVRVYYSFPPEVQKYLSGKPLRRGPERPLRKEKDKPPRPEKTDPNPDADKPSDPGVP